MNAVSNSTPLIYLSKLNKLEELQKFFEKIYIPEAVYREVVIKGKELNKLEVIVIEKLMSEKFIIVEKTNPKLEIKTLHIGELEAISLAQEKKIQNILIDDKEGVEVSKIVGLNPWRTTAILLGLLKLKVIKPDEFKSLLIDLSKSGYFISAEIFDYLIRESKKLL